jgi:putative CocE/NonD family hydrolase
LTLAAAAALSTARAAETTLPSEIPAQFHPATSRYDFVRRDVMIPMRDGVKLKTVILIPKNTAGDPILLTRTPYGAVARVTLTPSEHVGTIIGDGDVADSLVANDGYIRVFQDVRGKHDSEGDYVMNRPLAGPLNPTGIDESTDAYDTIDWLVKNTPESNGRVGILGISYDGFTTLMALIHPHPALKAAIPINAMVDGWIGDDWFHQGAFRTGAWGYVYEQEATRGSSLLWPSDNYDEYDDWLRAGSAGAMGSSHGLDQLGFFNKVTSHPAYDAFWQQQAVDKLLAAQTLTVPTMLVHSLWDQEDIYGNIAVWHAVKPHDTNNDLSLVIGPWFHHQERLDGSAIGPIAFGSDTAAWFRDHLLKPFFDRTLKGDDRAPKLAPVTAFQTGTNQWQSLPQWPPAAVTSTRIYLAPNDALSFTAPADADHQWQSYVSDPAKPVPYIPRPVHTAGVDVGRWQHWLVTDQRGVSSRPDVLSYETPPLTVPLTLAGQPIADIVEQTSGTDTDIVVKLIDVYPDEAGREPGLGGYQLMISADIQRGRYRTDFAHPAALTPNLPLAYRIVLPTTNHVFLPGHRIMVQLQSSWFPLYDRNPQTYVDNIFFAKPADYRAAEIRVFDSSAITLPVIR